IHKHSIDKIHAKANRGACKRMIHCPQHTAQLAVMGLRRDPRAITSHESQHFDYLITSLGTAHCYVY
ncbi:hypothetical protein J6590_103202, partial [Homalodisca vitripennis]